MPDVDKEIRNLIESSSELFEGVDYEHAEIIRPSIIDDARKLDNVTDKLRDDFADFLQGADLSDDIMEQYQTHLMEASNNTSRFSGFVSKAGSVLKGFGAALGSMAINWAIGEVIKEHRKKATKL